MADITKALKSLRPGAPFGLTNEDYSTLEWLDANIPVPTEQEVLDEITRLDALEDAEVARKEDTKNDTEGMAFLELMKSKTSAQRKDWLSSNVADPNVRKVLQGLMSIVLWKVA